jgi:hypothetical protein
MLTIIVELQEAFNEHSQEFVSSKVYPLDLEHSLVSLAKWESKWEKPFLSETPKTAEETLWYITAMTLTPDVPDEIYHMLSNDNLHAVNDYINAKMTATWFAKKPNKSSSREVITAELVYFWLITLDIPFECQHWHLNRLLTLVQVCNEKNKKPNAVGPKEAAARRGSLNAERKAKSNSQG